MNNKWTFAAAIFIIGLLVLFMYRKYKVAPEIDFSSLHLSDLDGQPVQPAFAGKKTVVCFGASWCGSCIKELNTIRNIQNTTLEGVEVIVISDETGEKIREFKEKKAYPFTFYKLDTSFGDIGINSIPVTYFFNTGGRLVKESVGYINWEDPSTANHLLKLME
jgi:thiol-disulfide isomerase/thioredoxin